MAPHTYQNGQKELAIPNSGENGKQRELSLISGRKAKRQRQFAGQFGRFLQRETQSCQMVLQSHPRCLPHGLENTSTPIHANERLQQCSSQPPQAGSNQDVLRQVRWKDSCIHLYTRVSSLNNLKKRRSYQAIRCGGTLKAYS